MEHPNTRSEVSQSHPLRGYFAAELQVALRGRLHMQDTEDVEAYLVAMLVRFLHREGVYAVRGADGRPVESVTEMVAEGDVRIRAASFEREREVHRHIGDFLLFWSGLFPESLPRLKSPAGKDALLDPVGQGRLSYGIAGSFDHGPYAQEAPTFRKLSADFEAYQFGLAMVRKAFRG